ncbi:hypothetical protein Poly30_16510 [Planctomycetes bacterium Poly30]|uniref:Uncharacterized protein n=1 Tax=Saltatorellus ferox TaxID=2528018 RepID=A0A518EPY3_9BACT|nr:hypothetical protein Poly30_16510 [Planctomycetes bacterium Poly30]
MANYTNCRAALVSSDIEKSWATIMRDLPEDSSAAANELQSWIESVRDETVHLIDDISSLDSSSLHLALRLVELRSQWAMLNTRLNFKMMKGEPYDTPMAFRGSLLTTVTEVIENALPQDDIDVITRFLGNPVKSDVVELGVVKAA